MSKELVERLREVAKKRNERSGHFLTSDIDWEAADRIEDFPGREK